jgi:hypothetical protein
MRFAKIVFWVAAIWGIVVLAPMYFLFDRVGQWSPPPVTHPEYYFGFVGVALAWQLAFAAIATDPARFRLLMLPAIVEKGSYVAAMTVLYLQQRITAFQFSTAVPDALLGLLFVIAFFKTRSVAAHEEFSA